MVGVVEEGTGGGTRPRREKGRGDGIAASPGNRVEPCLRDAVCSRIRKPRGNQEKQAK